MNKRPIFKLDPRLKLCADFVREGSKVADVGTDHAYLPIWLCKNNLVSKAIALDINEGPLHAAKHNIIKYHVDHIVEARISNGLDNVHPNEADDIIIAGMGGELIASIINRCNFLKNPDKRLILQPMSQAEFLRRFLTQNNFYIIDEKAIMSDKHIYSVMFIKFITDPIKTSSLYPYIGKLEDNLDQYAKIYIQKEIIHLKNKIKGLKCQNNEKLKFELLNTVNLLENLISEQEN